MYKKLSSIIAAAVVIMMPALASAHVVVKPNTAKVGDFVTFTVSVPNEKDSDVTNVKLDIPAGLEEVSPTVKPGWTITTEKSGERVTSINWADGTIPAGLRDDFTFSAQVPAKATELDWKAYQTYADGNVVHWDQKPAGGDDADGNAGPYSVTKVSNDLRDDTSKEPANDSSSNSLSIILSLVAVVISIGGLLFRKSKRM